MDVQKVARTTEMVECFRHEGDGPGYRLRKLCAGCGELAKTLEAARSAKRWE